MHRTRFRQGLLVVGMAALVVGIAHRPIHAVDDDNQPQIINCGDPRLRELCLECCSDECDFDTNVGLACCLDSKQGCTIINEPPTTGFGAADVVIKGGYAGLKLQLARKEVVTNGQALLKLKLKGSLSVGPLRKRLAIKGVVGGLDASVGSLAYAVLFIGRGDTALTDLQAQGMNVTLQVTGTPVTCQSSFTANECRSLAIQMAKLIYAALPPGDGPEQSAFLGSVAPLGYAPCQDRGGGALRTL